MPDVSLTPPVDVNDLLVEADEDYNWVVPGVFEEGDRLILTGNEGKGKSTLLRQLAVQIAQGVHPFTLDQMEPKRVLYLDLENSRKQIRRRLRDLCEPGDIRTDRLRIACWPEGLNLQVAELQAAVLHILTGFWPEVLIIGPMYKMGGELDRENDSAKLAALLDNWRQVFGFVLIMESHQPHQVVTQQMRYRPERPFGSSLWLRWPEFGICLEDDGTLRHWRGQRDQREWPEKLRWGDEWPWMVDNRLCLNCETALTEGQDKYCSTKCGSAVRQRVFKAKKRLL